MKYYINLIDSSFTPASYKTASTEFEKIALKEKTQWLPFYYASFSNIIIGTMEISDNEKDKRFKRGIELAEKANQLSPSNSEVLALKAFALQMYVSVSPYTRAFSNYSKVNELISKSISLNINNPRAYYLKGAGLYYSPAFFGGGKENALTELRIAEKKFNTSLNDSLLPHWGADWTQHMIKQCE